MIRPNRRNGRAESQIGQSLNGWKHRAGGRYRL